MAEETQAAASDPSMEEILASIRKIISDETPPTAAEEAAMKPPATAAEPAPSDEVLELTQMVEEDGSVTDLTAKPEAVAAVAPASPPAPAAPAAPAAAPAPVAEPASIEPSQPLVSENVASTASSKLSSLANTVAIERLASSPVTATFIGNGHRTLEDMAIELMRPLLKEWMDQNLTGVVERLVQKEIERIARR